MPEGLSPIERDLAANSETNFRNTLNTLSAHAEGILVEPTEGEDGPGVDMLMVLREGSYDPSNIHQTTVALGLDGAVQAVVTQEGSGVIVTVPVSVGRLGEIMDAGLQNDDTLTEAVSAARSQAAAQNRGLMGRTLGEITDMIAHPDTWQINPEVPTA